MRISYSWLQELFSDAPAIEKTAEILTNTGLEVEGVEAFESIPGGLTGLVVGEVLEVWKHPGADRLNLTRVNIGNDTELQIVCGAPNVAKGQKVIVATEGATLHPIKGEAFTIRKGKIRGELSQGMICAEDEIGLGKGHDGIMVLPEDATAGTPAGEYLKVYTDQCIEIGLTPNRTDAMSHAGIARDLRAAMLHLDGSKYSNLVEVLPNVGEDFDPAPKDPAHPIVVEIKNPSACHRYAGVSVSGIKVGDSPDWLKNRLKAIGLSPINNVVDVTNYVMHELGQPLHAFDAAKISGGKVVIRTAGASEKFTTLDGSERTLNEEDLMICDAEKPMCIAGVFGGLHSGITRETTEVFIESAVFDPVFVRKTARRHQLNTDASYRFERGVDASMALPALKRAAMMIQALTGGWVSNNLADHYPTPQERAAISVDLQSMNRLIGKEIATEKVMGILEDLDFEIVTEANGKLEILAPLCRRDVTRQADVAEEVLRIFGYNSVEIPQRLHSSVASIPKPNVEGMAQKVSDLLVARGFTEIMTNSLTKSAYAGRYEASELEESKSVKLLNPLSSDLGQMRQSMLFQGLETISGNINFKRSDLRLFEFGYVYHLDGEQIVETPILSLFVTGRKRPENWNNSNETASFTDLRSAFMSVLTALGADKNLLTEPLNHGYFSDALTIKRGEKELVRAGVLSKGVLKDADIRQDVFYAEINWHALLKVSAKNKVSFAALSKFPAVRRDLSVLLDKGVHFSHIVTAATVAERKLLKEVGLFDVYEGKNLEAGKKSYAVSFVLQDETATLTDKKIDAAMQRILNALKQELGAELRG